MFSFRDPSVQQPFSLPSCIAVQGGGPSSLSLLFNKTWLSGMIESHSVLEQDPQI